MSLPLPTDAQHYLLCGAAQATEDLYQLLKATPLSPEQHRICQQHYQGLRTQREQSSAGFDQRIRSASEILTSSRH